MKLDRVPAARRPAVLQIFLEPVEQGRRRRTRMVRSAADGEPALDRAAAHPQHRRDHLGRNTLVAQAPDFLIALFPVTPVGEPPAFEARTRDGGFAGRLLDRNRGRDGTGGLADGTAVTAGGGAQGVAQIAQQMPAIRDLRRLRRALADTVGVDPGPITSHHFDAGMETQPVGQAIGAAIGQQVDGAVPF